MLAIELPSFTLGNLVMPSQLRIPDRWPIRLSRSDNALMTPTVPTLTPALRSCHCMPPQIGNPNAQNVRAVKMQTLPGGVNPTWDCTQSGNCL
ncbi:hypothetical protein Pla52n_70180 [Stieleria varia]|uniref:Uncharacterized protein n=1 Tax=Stieleria varia TaxID=2528005 RepID=A0A5C5ZIU5_9BACT|nr:hypothetical protein Pla52n_70180 [Stieleria varia]